MFQKPQRTSRILKGFYIGIPVEWKPNTPTTVISLFSMHFNIAKKKNEPRAAKAAKNYNLLYRF
jgi:hypothetical protein